MIAARMPIPSPKRRSSSEILLKSSDELTCPSMKTSIPSLDASSRSASTCGKSAVAPSVSSAYVTKKITALPSSDAIGPRAAVSGSAPDGGGNDFGTAATTSGPRPRRSPRSPFTRSTKAGSCTAPSLSPATTKVSLMESSWRPRSSRSSFARFASGVFVKSKSVVSAGPSRVANDAIPATRIRNQMIMVLPGCRLLARASDSGLILTPGSPLLRRPSPARSRTVYAYDVRDPRRTS